MKPKMLFIMNNLNCGGAEKALVSLLQVIDYSKYEVDLFLFKHEGLFLPNIPKEVNLLPEPFEYQFFDMPFGKALLKAAKAVRFDIVLARIAMTYFYKTEKKSSVKEQISWRYISKCLKPLTAKYDLSVGYLQRAPNYFCVDKVTATKKVGFVHNDYDKLHMDIAIDRVYLQQLDKVFTISESCEQVLKKTFPELAQKFEIMYNIVSPQTIIALAKANITIRKAALTLVTVGRLHPQKGYELAIDACHIIKNKGFDVVWIVLGEGDERTKLEALIERHQLQENFILQGITENPYPYVKAADIYVQTSRFEGKSIAIDEAKILGKPIVVTDFETAKDQISDGVNGIIADMEAAAIANEILMLFENKNQMQQLVNNLSLEKLDNEEEIEKLYAIIKKVHFQSQKSDING